MKRTTDVTRHDIPFGVRASSQIPGWPPGTVRSLPRITPPSRVSGNVPHGVQPAATGAVVPPAISRGAVVSTAPTPPSNLPDRLTAAEVHTAAQKMAPGRGGMSALRNAFDGGTKRR
jgi:hypothetical protein